MDKYIVQKHFYFIMDSIMEFCILFYMYFAFPAQPVNSYCHGFLPSNTEIYTNDFPIIYNYM